MDYAWFVCELRRAYEHDGGVKTLRLGTLGAEWFSEIQRETASIVDWAQSIGAGVLECAARQARPNGIAKQFCLFKVPEPRGDGWNTGGPTRRSAAEKVVFPGLSALSRLAGLFGGNLRTFGITGVAPGSNTSALEEASIRSGSQGTDHIVRFHLPVFSNDRAFVYLDDERFNYKEGELYSFHHGCVHAAANFGDEICYAIVLDCFLDRTLFNNLFPGAPSVDADFRKSVPGEEVVPGEAFVFSKFLCENGRAMTNGIKYGRRAPTVLDFYRHNYPFVFAWLRRRKPAHSRRFM